MSKLSDSWKRYDAKEIHPEGKWIWEFDAVETVEELEVEILDLEHPWISVDERLPDERRNVFVRCRTSSGETDYSIGYLWEANKWSPLTPVTHWMPIPPLEEQSNG